MPPSCPVTGKYSFVNEWEVQLAMLSSQLRGVGIRGYYICEHCHYYHRTHKKRRVRQRK